MFRVKSGYGHTSVFPAVKVAFSLLMEETRCGGHIARGKLQSNPSLARESMLIPDLIGIVIQNCLR